MMVSVWDFKGCEDKVGGTLRNHIPVFVYLAKLILVTALEFPKFAVFETNESRALSPLNQ